MNLHKPLTAQVYHLIGPRCERHLNWQTMQKMQMQMQKKKKREKKMGYFNLQVSDKYGNFASEVCSRKPQAVVELVVNEVIVDHPVAATQINEETTYVSILIVAI